MKEKEAPNPSSNNETDESGLRNARDLVLREWEGHSPNNETGESWLRKAAVAPEEAKKVVAQLNPIPPLAPTVPLDISPSELAHAPTPFLEPPSSPSSSQVIAPSEERYELGKEFARGGLGRILSAKDKKLSRVVAIKELLSDNVKTRERFLREVFLTAKLEHPSIVPIHDIGVRPNGELYYAMKLVDGRSLDKIIAEKKTLRERLALLPQVLDACRAIAYAHSKGVIHRDLKPHNIMVGAFGETIVIDWGLAKEIEENGQRAGDRERPQSEPYRDPKDEADLTKAGSVLGTPAYMPPEQAKGERVDQRADVYSLGAILYSLLAGVPPYQGRRAQEAIAQVLSGPPRALESLVKEAPKELLAIIDKAMERDSEKRYPDAGALVDDLNQFQTGNLVGAHQYSAGQLFLRWVRRHRVLSALLVMGLVAGVLSYIGIAREQRETAKALTLAQKNEEEANATKDKLREEVDRLVLSKAREALTRDPSEALAWLKRLPVTSSQWSAARVIATSAYLEGVSDVFFEDGSLEEAKLSPDGALLVTLSKGELSLWSVTSREPTLIRVLKSGVSERLVLAFSQDSKQLAASKYELKEGEGISIWELSTGKESTLSGYQGPLNEMLFSPDGRYLGSIMRSLSDLGSWEISVWELSSGRRFSSPVTDSVITTMTFSLDSSHLWLGGSRSGAQENEREPLLLDWSFISGEVKTLSSSHWPQSPRDSIIRSVLFLTTLPNGEIFSAASFLYDFEPHGETIFLHWDISGQATKTRKNSCLSSADEMAASPSGKLLAVFCREDETVGLYDLLRGDWLEYDSPNFPAGMYSVSRMAFSPNEDLLALAIEGNIYLLDLSDRENLHLLKLTKQLRGHIDVIPFLGFSSDESLFSFSTDGTLRRWEVDLSIGYLGSLLVAPDRLIKENKTPSLLGLYFTSDRSSFIAPELRSGEVSVWSTKDWKQSIIGQHGAPLYASAASQDGAYLAVGGEDGKIDLWDIRSQPKLLRTLAGHQKVVISLAFSPDGKTLASGSWDQTIRLWDLKTFEGKEINAGERVDLVQFSGDGTQLIASCDRLILRWDPVSGKALEKIAEQDHREIVASPKGHFLAIHSPPSVEVVNLKTDERRTLSFPVEPPYKSGVPVPAPGEPEKNIPRMRSVMAFSPDGEYLAVSSRDGSVHLVSMSTGQERILTTNKRHMGDLVFSPDGKGLLASMWESEGLFWDIASEERRPMRVGEISAFSRDGSFFVTANMLSQRVSILSWPVLPKNPNEMQAWLEKATNLQIKEP